MPSSAHASPVSPMWSLGVFTSRLSRLRCHGSNRSTRNALQHGDVVMNRLTRHLKRCCEIDTLKLGRVRRSEREQPRQRVQGMDTGHVTCIALNLRFDEIAVPGSPPGRRPPRQCRRVSPADDAFSERESEPIRDLVGKPPRKSVSMKRGRFLVELALRERMQPQNAMRPASESARCGTSRTLAEPVRMNRPAVRRWSMAAFSDVKISGTRWTSSRIVRRGSPSTKPTGSRLAASWTASSSNDK